MSDPFWTMPDPLWRKCWSCGFEYTLHMHTVCPRCFAWPAEKAPHMTRQQFMALHSVVLDRAINKRQPGTREWIDVSTDTVVTIDDLLALLSIKI